MCNTAENSPGISLGSVACKMPKSIAEQTGAEVVTYTKGEYKL